jgi:hypothetical protein
MQSKFNQQDEELQKCIRLVKAAAFHSGGLFPDAVQELGCGLDWYYSRICHWRRWSGSEGCGSIADFQRGALLLPPQKLCGSSCALQSKLAKFRESRQHPQHLQADPITAVELKSSCILRMSLQLVGQKARYIDGNCAIKAGMRYAGEMVVMCDRLNGKSGDTPQSKQVSADLRSGKQGVSGGGVLCCCS